tara:strand:- start:41 stop:937 length:897 start_codon:yes stop_codon:yes gene_type:complete
MATINYYQSPFQAVQPQPIRSGGINLGNGYVENLVWDNNSGYVPYNNRGIAHPAVVEQIRQGNVVPTSTAVPASTDVQYQLKPDQAIEKWGKSKRVVGKDAPEGLLRNLAGLADFATFGIYDFDRRGNLFGGKHLPGLSGGLGGKVEGSGYGGQAEVAMPEVAMPQPEMTPNVPLPADPRTANTGMLGHLGTSAALSIGNRFLDDYAMRAANNRLLQGLTAGRQILDPMDVNRSQMFQDTTFGKSKMLDAATNRTATLTNAALAGAQKNLTNAQRVALLKQGAVLGSVAGMQGSGRAI